MIHAPLSRFVLTAALLAPLTALAQDAGIRLLSNPTEEIDDSRFARFLVADEAGSALNPVDSKFVTKRVEDITRIDGQTASVYSNTRRGGDEARNPVVVPPGTYIVELACEGGGFYSDPLIPLFKPRAKSRPVQVEAGFDYTFTCTGRAAGRLHAEVTVQPRSEAATRAFAAPRPSGPGTHAAASSDLPWSPPADGAPTGIPDQSIALPAGLSDNTLSFLVEDALSGHDWAIKERHARWVRAALHVEDIVAVVDVVRDGDMLKVVYVDSENLGYRNAKGKIRIDGEYAAWVQVLLDDIATILRVGGQWADTGSEAFDAPWVAPAPTPYTPIPVQRLALPGPIDRDTAFGRIENTIKHRDWVVLDRHRDWNRLMLRVRTHLVIVDAVLTDGELQVVYRDSSHLDFEEKKGAAVIHRAYYNWTDYLLRDMAAALNVPPPPER